MALDSIGEISAWIVVELGQTLPQEKEPDEQLGNGEGGKDGPVILASQRPYEGDCTGSKNDDVAIHQGGVELLHQQTDEKGGKKRTQGQKHGQCVGR